MKKVLFFVLALFIMTSAMAQSRVTGKVTSSEDGSPLPFVTILIQGERGLGTNTDIDGNFVIERCPADAVLVLSYVGYTTMQVPVNGRSVINITMQPDALALEEVMVVAYGTAKKGTYTGSAAVVRSEAIKDVPTMSFEKALSGKVAGMQITTTSGQAGSAPNIRVRGIGSMNASNEPLYVIDGVPVVSGGTGQMSDYIYTSNNIMNSLNPQDIESITVLKDAAASALYGSRAANGVILITTKRGRLGKPVITFKTAVGLTPSFATVNFDPASPEEQVELYYENFFNAGKYEGKTDAASSNDALRQLNNRWNKHGYRFTADDNSMKSLKIHGMTDGIENREGKFYDWGAFLFRTAIYQTHDLSVSGGTDRATYYSSISYTNEQGRSTSNDFSRISGRINVTQKVGKYVEVSSSANLAHSVQHGFNDTRNTGANYFMQHRNLLWPMYWPTNYKTGEPWTARYGSYAYNHVYYNDHWDNFAKVLRIGVNESIAVKFMPELILKSVLSFDNTSSRDHVYYDALHFSGSSTNGSVNEMYTSYNKLVSSTTLSYDKEFAGKHNVSALVGWEAEENKTDFTRASGTNLATDALNTVATAGTHTANAYHWGYTMLSMLSRAEYSYDGRYYVSGSFRRDGSSRLGVNTRWGNFWSVAGSWRISNEAFMKNIPQISNLRLRGSYGVNGTLPSSNYGWRALASYGNRYMDAPGGGIANIADANLAWETSYTWNVALEAGLFNNRLNATVEYFNRDSKDLLQSVPISTVTGFGSTLRNIGEINNHGIEIELSGDIIRTSDLTWSAGLTGSWIKSTVTKLYGGDDIVWYDPYAGDARAKFIYREGESTLAYYGLEWAGVERETGFNLWYLNNDKQPDLTVNGRPATYSYSKASEVILGEAHPKFFGGFSTDLTWKGLSVGLNFIYKIGGYTYNAPGRDINDDGYYWERIMSKFCYDNRWTPENKDAKYPKRIAIDMEDINQKSSRHMNPADFVRLKNITVAYTLPRTLTSKVGIQNARVYFNGANLWTWAAHKEYDPEVGNWGSRGWEMPIGKTYTFGLEFSF